MNRAPEGMDSHPLRRFLNIPRVGHGVGQANSPPENPNK